MCGIVGYVGAQEAAPILLDGLRRLEYRGYDSAGMAVCGPEGLQVCKTRGRLQALADLTEEGRTLTGTLGVGHTRWATHGEPNDINAHPQVSQSGLFAVVHNGIIENYALLRAQLTAKGYAFRSETDTEVVAQLLDYYYAASRDVFEGSGHAVIVQEPFAPGVLCFTQPGAPGAPCGYNFAAACGDDDTDMFLDAPGMGSRDLYAPFIIKKAGVEYLQITGNLYVDADTVPALACGDVCIAGEQYNAQFKVKAGSRVRFQVPPAARVIVTNDKLETVWHSGNGQPLPDSLDEGYILFASDIPVNIPVTVE